MLKGNNLVLIGASSTIGGHFLKEVNKQGVRCVAIGRRPPRVPDVPHIEGDVTSLSSLTAAAADAFRLLGRVDTVLNFSGTHHKPMDLVKDNPVDLMREFERVVQVNLTGAFLITAVFSRRLVAQRHGHLIHLCSNASRLSLYGSYAYNASKHGLEGLIKTAAAQLAPFGVRVNGIAPGTVETDLNRQLLRGEGKAGGLSARAASILAHTPTKRFATLEGITETVIAMCAPQRHLTGNIVFCDDGYNVEGHSWPEGNRAVYDGADALDALYSRLEKEYPHD